MKRLGMYAFSVLLSLLILLGGGHYTVGKMICLGSGHTSYSLGNAKVCCEKSSSSCETIANSCCKLVDVTYTLDQFFPSFDVLTQDQSLIYILPVFEFAAKLSMYMSTVFYYADIPPPDSSDRLYVFCSLLL